MLVVSRVPDQNRMALFPECGDPFGKLRSSCDHGSRERVDDTLLFLSFRRIDHNLRDFNRSSRSERQAARQVFCSGEALASGHYRIDDPEPQCLTGGEHFPEYGHSADRSGTKPAYQALCSRPAGHDSNPRFRLPDPNLFLRDPVVGAYGEFQSPPPPLRMRHRQERR